MKVIKINLPTELTSIELHIFADEHIGDAHCDMKRLMERIEDIGKRLVIEKNGREIPICANVDMYSGLVYKMLGIPEELYTPLFAIARIAGWCAHCIEEKMTVGKITRPAYRSAAKKKAYIPIEER